MYVSVCGFQITGSGWSAVAGMSSSMTGSVTLGSRAYPSSQQYDPSCDKKSFDYGRYCYCCSFIDQFRPHRCAADVDGRGTLGREFGSEQMQTMYIMAVPLVSVRKHLRLHKIQQAQFSRCITLSTGLCAITTSSGKEQNQFIHTSQIWSQVFVLRA